MQLQQTRISLYGVYVYIAATIASFHKRVDVILHSGTYVGGKTSSLLSITHPITLCHKSHKFEDSLYFPICRITSTL